MQVHQWWKFVVLDITWQADKIATLLKAANVKVQSYWPALFAKLLEKRNVEDLITNVGSGKCCGSFPPCLFDFWAWLQCFWVVALVSALGAKFHGCSHVIDLEASWFRAEASNQEFAWQVEVGLPWLWALDLVVVAVLLRKKLQSRRRRKRYRTLVISCLSRVLNFCPWQWCFLWPLPCIHGYPLAVGSRSETWKIHHKMMLNSSSYW